MSGENARLVVPCPIAACFKRRRQFAPEYGLVVETASAREVHHFAVLAGYGAEAVHPYLAMETLVALHKELPGELSAEKRSAKTGEVLWLNIHVYEVDDGAESEAFALELARRLATKL